MANTYVTNITHFLDESGAIAVVLEAPGKELAENLTKIITSVTTQTKITTATGIQCWNKENGSDCQGKIEAGIALDQDNLIWECKTCGDKGSISHWENTFWDQRGG